MNMMINLDFVARIDEERQAAEELALAAAKRRNRAVLEAVESGHRPIRVATRLGISDGRVSQILRQARREREEEKAEAER